MLHLPLLWVKGSARLRTKMNLEGDADDDSGGIEDDGIPTASSVEQVRYQQNSANLQLFFFSS